MDVSSSTDVNLEGVRQLNQRNFPAALRTFDLLRSETGYPAECHIQRGLALAGMYQYHDALKSLDQAAECETLKISALIHKSNVLMRLQRHRESIACSQKILLINSWNSEAYQLIGTAFQKLNQFAEALTHLSRAIQLNPSGAESYLTRAFAHHRLGSPERGRQDLESALWYCDSSPTTIYEKVETFALRGVALIQLQRPWDAIQCLEKSLELDPNYAYAHNNLGRAYHCLKDQKNAARCYDRAIELDKFYAPVFRNKGILFEDQRDYDTALLFHRKALEVFPDFVDGHVSMGDTYSLKKQHHIAIDHYDVATKLAPKDSFLWFNRGTALYNLGRFRESEQSYFRALEIDPRLDATHLNRGEAQFNLKEYEQSLRSFTHSSEQDEESSLPFDCKEMSRSQLIQREREVSKHVQRSMDFPSD